MGKQRRRQGWEPGGKGGDSAIRDVAFQTRYTIFVAFFLDVPEAVYVRGVMYVWDYSCSFCMLEVVFR